MEDQMSDRAGLLLCPETKMELIASTLAEAEADVGASLMPLRQTSSPQDYAEVLLREDRQVAYPVVDGIPVLLVPEALGKPGGQVRCSPADPKYAEAYEEMDFYNRVATQEAEQIQTSDAYAAVAPVYQANPDQLSSFPDPAEIWLDSVYDCVSQWDAYDHLAPLSGKRMLQLGGKGIHAVKFLLCGAREAWVVSPMIGELRCARALAKVFGVADRLRCAVAIAEELPLRADSFDAVYCGGCLHHMVLDLAVKEVKRVLRAGGKFAAVEPWKTPLHTIGTRILGKRERSIHCRPLTRARVEPLYHVFREAKTTHHGTLTRYPLLALMKFGLSSSVSTVWRVSAIDDALCSRLPGMRRWGSSIACLAVK